jgi:hypothetical protein
MLARSAVLLLFLATAAAANPNCPSNYVQAGGVNMTSTDATNSATDSGHCQFSTGFWSASYDIPAGRFSVNASFPAGCGGGAIVVVQDDFKVIGLPAGTPLQIVAVLHASANSATTTLTDSDGNHVTIGAIGQGTIGDVTLPIAAIAEQPFHLTFDALAGVNAAVSGAVDADFHFTGLPPGTAVVSCNGYVSDRSVPVRAITWGRLKAHYR